MAQTKVNWKHDDPMSDRAHVLSEQKGFKNAKFPKTDFVKRKVREEIDAFYHPHTGGEKQ